MRGAGDRATDQFGRAVRLTPGTPERPWETAEPASLAPGPEPTAAPEPTPIVFAHGTRLSRTAWRPQLERLGRTRRCVAVDLPGHGFLAAKPFTLPGAVAAVRRAIDEAAGGRAIVVGLSLGGYTAIELAAAHPERVAGLVLAGTSQEPVGLRRLPYLLLAEILARTPRSWLAALDGRLFRWRYGTAVAAPLIEGGFWSRGGAVAVRAVIGRRYLPSLARHSGPVAILNGQFDLLFRLGAQGFLRTARERGPAWSVVLPGALHLSNLDAPDAFTAEVERLAAHVDADRAGGSGPVGRREPGGRLAVSHPPRRPRFDARS